MNLKSLSKILLIVSIPVILLLMLSSYAASADDTTDYPVPPPPFSEGIFPCSGCHAGMEANTNRRELSFHEDIKLKHFDGWCFNCHNPGDRDTLRLASGKIISFKESEYLCGQCHGTMFRDWKVGVHGKRTGFWNGKKEYRLCVHCHSPHQPGFKPLKPLPPPIRPEDSKYKTSETIPLNPLDSIKE
ncbi:MAG: hypothetical protein HY758_11325 [Nitrospirae bacterium]|nr:hypothetical protein [Nitrospirota bacterium]